MIRIAADLLMIGALLGVACIVRSLLVSSVLPNQPKVKTVRCANCAHAPLDHLAHREKGSPAIDWMCYGSDREGVACACPKFEPEVI